MIKKLLLGILSLLPVSAFAGQLATGDVMEIISAWDGGLNTTQESHLLGPNESPNLRNILIDEKPGSIVKSNGYILAATTPTLSKIVAMYPFELSNGTKYLIVSDSSRVLATTDFTNFLVVQNNLNTGGIPECKQIRDKIWCTNGLDSVFTWDGTTTVVLNGSTYGGVPTPVVPKGKYITFYQGRVFVYNDNTDNSLLSFSAVSDTNGVIIAPDNQFAWIDPTFALSIGKGDGQVGTALWVMNGLLYAAKERSIYAIFGQDQFTYNAKNIDNEVGVAAHDSIGYGDNLVYFVGRDGIYKHTGTKSIRISDRIVPDFNAIVKDNSRVVTKTWNTQADFAIGSFSNSTPTIGGVILTTAPTLINTTPTDGIPASGFPIPFRTGNDPNNPTVILAKDYTVFTPTTTVSANSTWRISSIKLWCRVVGNIWTIQMKVRNKNNTNLNETYSRDVTVGVFALTDWQFAQSTGNVTFTAAEVAGSSITIAISTGALAPQGQTDEFDFYTSTTLGAAQITMVPATSTGQFVSEIATATTITVWGSFNAVSQTNGGTVNYFFRSATSPVNIAGATWAAISPGTIIGASTANLNYQWASTMTQTVGNSSPFLDYITIDHVEGSGSLTRAVGIQWKNRYWLAVSTESSGNLTLLYIKAKITNSNPDAWVACDGINIRSIARFNNNLYGGSATAGQIYRLDYGTNYNGSNFTSFYETRDMLLNSANPYNTFLEKSQVQYLVDVQKNGGGSMLVGTSANSGSYTNISVDLSGNGRLFKSLYNLSTPYTGFWFRYHFENSDLDKNWQLNRFGVVYTPTQTMP